MKKAEAHGIDGKVLKWIGDWLNCKKQRVQINGKKSVALGVRDEWGTAGRKNGQA